VRWVRELSSGKAEVVSRADKERKERGREGWEGRERHHREAMGVSR